MSVQRMTENEQWREKIKKYIQHAYISLPFYDNDDGEDCDAAAAAAAAADDHDGCCC